MNEIDNNEDEGKRKLIKLVVIVNVILLIGACGFIAYNFFSKEMMKENTVIKNTLTENRINEAAKETLNEIKAIENNKEQEQKVTDYDFVHQMSNNLIIADDGEKWGAQEVTLENIDLGIEMLKDNEYIVTELNKWKLGEFENAVEVHNYCWTILEGDRGKASSLSQEGIDAALKAIGKE